jgi:hypothetical protein
LHDEGANLKATLEFLRRFKALQEDSDHSREENKALKAQIEKLEEELQDK